MQITTHASYEEITRNKHGIKNDPTPEQLTRIKTLLERVFEPCRVWTGKPIRINSCFRNEAVNRAARGAGNSQHLCNNGAAIDLEYEDNKELFNYIRENLDFDQLINEADFSWIHVSFNEGHNRKEVLKMNVIKGEKVYTRI